MSRHGNPLTSNLERPNDDPAEHTRYGRCHPPSGNGNRRFGSKLRLHQPDLLEVQMALARQRVLALEYCFLCRKGEVVGGGLVCAQAPRDQPLRFARPGHLSGCPASYRPLVIHIDPDSAVRRSGCHQGNRIPVRVADAPADAIRPDRFAPSPLRHWARRKSEAKQCRTRSGATGAELQHARPRRVNQCACLLAPQPVPNLRALQHAQTGAAEQVQHSGPAITCARRYESYAHGFDCQLHAPRAHIMPLPTIRS
jgi:hypothetical protein